MAMQQHADAENSCCTANSAIGVWGRAQACSGLASTGARAAAGMGLATVTPVAGLAAKHAGAAWICGGCGGGCLPWQLKDQGEISTRSSARSHLANMGWAAVWPRGLWSQCPAASRWQVAATAADAAAAASAQSIHGGTIMAARSYQAGTVAGGCGIALPVGAGQERRQQS